MTPARSKHVLLRWGWVLALLGLALAACAGRASAPGSLPGAPDTSLSEASTPPEVGVDEGALETEEVTSPSPQVAEPTPTAEVATQEAVPNPAPRTELVATDPGTVSLASGQYQLIEFFAFW